MTRHRGMQELQKYIESVYGAKGSTTLQSLCEEYKFKRDSGQSANCPLHAPDTICLISQAPAAPMVFNHNLPLPTFAMPPVVISPEAEMDTCTPSHQQQALGSAICSTGFPAPVAQRLRPDANEFVPNRQWQAKSGFTKDAIEHGLGAHMGVRQERLTNSISTPANTAVNEAPPSADEPSSSIGNSSRWHEKAPARMLEPQQAEELAIASAAEDQKTTNGTEGGEATEVADCQTSGTAINTVMPPVNGLVGPTQNYYAELVMLSIRAVCMILSALIRVSKGDSIFSTLPVRQPTQAVVTAPSARMAMLLQDTEPTSPSDGRYGPIGLGRPRRARRYSSQQIFRAPR